MEASAFDTKATYLIFLTAVGYPKGAPFRTCLLSKYWSRLDKHSSLLNYSLNWRKKVLLNSPGEKTPQGHFLARQLFESPIFDFVFKCLKYNYYVINLKII